MKRTQLARGPASLKRSALTRKPTTARRPAQRPATAPKTGDWPQEVRDTVTARTGGLCEVRIDGKCTGTATDLHHRQPRRTRQHTVGNALHCCRSCHGAVHTVSPALSAHMGWTVTTYAPNPAAHPVFIAGGWVLLTDIGRYQRTTPPL